MANLRDTQYAEWASLLIEELCAVEGIYFDVIHEDWKEHWQKIIARRTFDLVNGVLDGLYVPLPKDEVVGVMPDLSKLFFRFREREL